MGIEQPGRTLELGLTQPAPAPTKRSRTPSSPPPADTAATVWGSYDNVALRGLISEQIPRFQSRPYLADASTLAVALNEALDVTLEGDYCWSLNFAPAFIRALCFEGFLPICSELGGGTGLFVLLPKLHEQRCVLCDLAAARVPKKLRRRAVREAYTLTVDDAFEEVISGCVRQHGAAAWLHPPLRRALAAMRVQDVAARGRAGDAPGGRGDAGAVRTCCFALWRGGELVAGEFGTVAGRVYTSFSGFHSADGAGTVQMAMTARLLARAGVTWWDMGQEHAYKLQQGASVLPRAAFLDAFRRERARPNALAALCEGRRFGAAELLAADLLPRAPMADEDVPEIC